MLNSIVYTPYFPSLMKSTVSQVAFRSDIYETDTAYVIESELPGFEKDEISATIKEGLLTIRAAHKADAEAETEEEKSSAPAKAPVYLRKERNRGERVRVFRVEGVDESGVTAAYRSGILTLTLPKVLPVEPETTVVTIV